MIGAEEGLLALDLMTLGFSIVYAPALVVHHFPAKRSAEARSALVARNDLWTAWLRRQPRVVLRQALAFAAKAASTNRPLRTLLDALRGLTWSLRNRRVVPPYVEALCRLVEDRQTAKSRRSRRASPSPERIAPLDLRFARLEDMEVCYEHDSTRLRHSAAGGGHGCVLGHRARARALLRAARIAGCGRGARGARGNHSALPSSAPHFPWHC